MAALRRVDIAALAFAAALMGLDAGSFGPLLPALRAGLRLDDPHAAWLLSAYVVGTLLGNPGNGWVHARFGPSRALSLGLAVYAAGALAMTVATTAASACGARWLQGLGAGSLLAIATATVAARAPVARRGRAIIALSLAYAVAFLAASATASFVGASAWRWAYAGLALVAGVGAALTARAFDSKDPGEAAPLDAGGLARWALTVAALAVMVPLTRGATLGPAALAVAATVALGGFAASVAGARGVEQPFVPLGLLRVRAVRGASALAFGAGVGQVFAVALPSFAAVTLGVAPSRVSLWSLPFVLAGLVGTALAAVVIDRLGARRVVRATGLALVVGALLLAAAPASGAAFVAITALLGAGLCTLSGGPIRHLVGGLGGADGARAQTLLALVTNLGLLAGSAVFAALGSPHGDLARRALAMRAGAAALAVLVAAALVSGLSLLGAATDDG